MCCKWLRQLSCMVALLAAATAAQAEDLHFKKNISVSGNVVSSSETSIKGQRTRDVTQTPAGATVSLRQCDLKRTVTLNDQTQSYLVVNDPQDAAAARAAALVTGAPAPEAEKKSGGHIDINSTITDTGERKPIFGLTARHLKIKIVEKSSDDACTKVDQTFEVDGWYADLGKDIASCTSVAPPVRQSQGCLDAIVEHHSGSARAGYPLLQNVTMHNPDGSSMVVSINVNEVNKGPLDAALFDVPANYKQVNSLAELQEMPQVPQNLAQAQAQAQAQAAGQAYNPATNPNNPYAAQAAVGAMGQQAMSQYTAQGAMGGAMGNMGAMMHGGNQVASAPIAVPQALGPKAPGKIRIGVAPPDAQVGQGSNAQADYSTPIRNAMILLMNGPAVEIAALDARVSMQLQAEAQQKQCDYILMSSVAVKHAQGGGFGKFMKMGGTMAQMTPMGAMAHGMGGAVAASAASAAASAAAQAAQQQAMNQVMSQLSGFNGQIKQKDDVTVQYQLTQTGQGAPLLQNALQGKAKSDGEDVLTPLLQQTANTVLTQVSTKK